MAYLRHPPVVQSLKFEVLLNDSMMPSVCPVPLLEVLTVAFGVVVFICGIIELKFTNPFGGSGTKLPFCVLKEMVGA